MNTWNHIDESQNMLKKNSQTQEYILNDFFHIQFQKRQNCDQKQMTDYFGFGVAVD